MNMDYEEYILDLVGHVNNMTNDKFDVRGLKPIGNQEFKNNVGDNALKFYLPGVTPENNAVLMVSVKAFPDFIERAVNNSRVARGVLSDKHSAVVLDTISDGRFLGLSYAVWPKNRPFSSIRLVQKIQKRWLEPRLFSWLQGVAEDSIVRNLDGKSVGQYIQSPLECVANNATLSDNVRSCATVALQHLETSQWIPLTILQHSDFWLGNVLLLKNRGRSSDNQFGFCVIDWGGAFVNGAPVFDLVRLCMSLRVSSSTARREFLNYAQVIKSEPGELIYYLICALGLIGMNIEQFPEDRYIRLCENNVSYLQTAGFEV